jgi:hypothetical protein
VSSNIRNRIPFTVVELCDPKAPAPEKVVMTATGQATLKEPVGQKSRGSGTPADLKEPFVVEISQGKGFNVDLPYVVQFTPSASISGTAPTDNSLRIEVRSSSKISHINIPPKTTPEVTASASGNRLVDTSLVTTTAKMASQLRDTSTRPVTRKRKRKALKEQEEVEKEKEGEEDILPRKKVAKPSRYGFGGKDAQVSAPSGSKKTNGIHTNEGRAPIPQRVNDRIKAAHHPPSSSSDISDINTPGSGSGSGSINGQASDIDHRSSVPVPVPVAVADPGPSTVDPAREVSPLHGRPFYQHFVWPRYPDPDNNDNGNGSGNGNGNGNGNPRALRRNGAFYWKTHPNVFWDRSWGERPRPDRDASIKDCMPPWMKDEL